MKAAVKIGRLSTGVFFVDLDDLLGVQKVFFGHVLTPSPCPLGDAALGSHAQQHAVQDQLLFPGRTFDCRKQRSSLGGIRGGVFRLRSVVHHVTGSPPFGMFIKP